MRIATAVIALAACATLSSAQVTPPKADLLNAFFFPAELVMAHQSDLELTTAQRETLRNEVLKAQGTFTMIQFKLSEEGEALAKLLAMPTVDEGAAMAQVDKVLNYEHAAKRAQLTLMIHIKNLLTPTQQARLQEIRKREE